MELNGEKSQNQILQKGMQRTLLKKQWCEQILFWWEVWEMGDESRLSLGSDIVFHHDVLQITLIPLQMKKIDKFSQCIQLQDYSETLLLETIWYL